MWQSKMAERHAGAPDYSVRGGAGGVLHTNVASAFHFPKGRKK